MAQAAGRHGREVRAAARSHHGQGQRRGPVTVRGRPQGDPGRRGRDRPEQRRDRHHRDGRRGRRRARQRPWRSRRKAVPRRKGRPRSSRATPMRPAGPRVRPARTSRRRPKRNVPRRRPPLRPRPAPLRRRRPLPAAAPAAAAPAAQAAPTATAAASTGDPDARMTPAVRRLLREHALRPDQIVGTGGGGRITRDDVLAVVESIRTGGTPAVPVMAQGNGATAPAACGPHLPQPTGPGRATGPHAGRRPDRVPRGRRRGPPPDDPDAQGHRRADDPGARGPACVRAHGGRRDEPRQGTREGQARLPGPRGHLAELRALRDQGRGRGPARFPGIQRPLDGERGARQAPRPHGRRGRRRRRAPRAGRPRRRPAEHQRPEPGDRRCRGSGTGGQAEAGRLRRKHLHDRQHRLVRLEPHDADHQRAGGRDPHDGGDHQAPGRPGRRRTATSSRSGRS